jgi:hypothetical protein
MDNTTIALFEEPKNRRLNKRYPLHLNLKWTIAIGKKLYQGEGRTENISSKGVLFKTAGMSQKALRKGIELRIEWPFMLDGEIPLLLICSGRIVRVESSLRCAVSILRTEFRTCKLQSNERVFEATA